MNFFADTGLQQKFETKGYVVVDVLNATEIGQFLQFWKSSPHTFDKGTFTSVFSWPPQLNSALSDLTRGITQHKIDALLPGWMVEGATYTVKGPKSSASTEFSLHQDNNVVDENHAPSLGLWIALVDTDIKNGGLCVLPGSHEKFKGTIRGTGMPSLFLNLDKDVEPFVEHIQVKAGQACIFAHSLFHGSPENITDEERIVLHAGIFAPGSKALHYYKNSEGVIEVLEVDRLFYYRNIAKFYANAKSSPHEVIGTLMPAEAKAVSKDIVLREYGVSSPASAKPNWFNRFKRILKSN